MIFFRKIAFVTLPSTNINEPGSIKYSYLRISMESGILKLLLKLNPFTFFLFEEVDGPSK